MPTPCRVTMSRRRQGHPARPSPSARATIRRGSAITCHRCRRRRHSPRPSRGRLARSMGRSNRPDKIAGSVAKASGSIDAKGPKPPVAFHRRMVHRRNWLMARLAAWRSDFDRHQRVDPAGLAQAVAGAARRSPARPARMGPPMRERIRMRKGPSVRAPQPIYAPAPLWPPFAQARFRRHAARFAR